MKSLFILFYDCKSFHAEDKLFSDKNGFQMALSFAESVKNLGIQGVKDIEDSCESYKSSNVHNFEIETVIFCFDSNKENVQKYINDNQVLIISRSEWTIHNLFESMSILGREKNVDFVLFSFADLPFMRINLTQKIIFSHIEYNAEYTFADGYPYGLAPECICMDTVAILEKLSSTTFESQGKKSVSRSSIFDFLKLDINSFDIETVIAPVDYRLARISLDCATKAASVSCKQVYDSKVYEFDDEKMCDLIVNDVQVIKNLPSFYELSITEKTNIKSIYIPLSLQKDKEIENEKIDMKDEDFYNLLEKIQDFSESAVISFSAFGECLLHPSFFDFSKKVLEKQQFSLLIETDGLSWTEETCIRLKEIIEQNKDKLPFEGFEKLMILIRIDAFSSEIYEAIHGNKDLFEVAVRSVSLISKYFPGCVYPQFVRMDINECELESFYRYWSSVENPSGGKFVIQKYNSYCKALPSRKSADLSPLQRNPCWHLRRDIVVFADGRIPVCKSQFDSKIGNAFSDKLKDIWKKLDCEVAAHIEGKVCEKCGLCDEYYTYNF